MDFFESSGHFKQCIYSLERVNKERKRVHENAVKASSLSELWTEDDELTLLRHYQAKVPEICHFFKFSPGVVETAEWLLSRFSLRHSWLEYDPKHIMLACILLATKCENLHLTMDQFAKKIPNTDAQLLLELEFVLLDAFDHVVLFFSPTVCLLGFWVQLKDAGIAVSLGLLEQAKHQLATLIRTDAILLYRPSLLALFALALTLSELPDEMVNRIAEQDFALVKTLLATKVDPEKVKAVDRKLITIKKDKLK